jgi:hypothetical protein
VIKVRQISTGMAAAAMLLGAAVVPAHASAAPGSAPSSLSCYDTAGKFASYEGGPGENSFFPERGAWMKVQGNCADVNVKPEKTRNVRVCTRNKCHGWVKASANQWAVAFKNSVPGAEYYLQFEGRTSVVAYVAD